MPPPVPPPSSGPRRAPVPASGESLGMPRQITAVLAYLFIFVGGVAVLFLEKRDRFVRFHAVQSIILGVLLGLERFLLGMVNWLFGNLPLIGGLVKTATAYVDAAFGLCWFLLWVVAMVAAFLRREWQIPYLGALVRQQFGNRY